MNKLVPFTVLTLAVVYFYCCNDSFDSGSIKGKRVLITGSSSGIGEHLAYEYSKLGAKVFLTARRENLLEKVAKKCKKLGAKEVTFVTSDLSEEKDRDNVIAEVKKRFGGLDHLILNHAIAPLGLWLGTKESMKNFLKLLDVNFMSFVDLASQAMSMLTESKGSIGVVSSLAGKMAFPASASYCATKHAIHGFFSTLRQELMFSNIEVSVTTCVIGLVDTDMMNQTQDVRGKLAAVFLGFDLMETPEDAASAIMQGVTNKKYEIYFGKIMRVLVEIHKIFPVYFENIYSKQALAVFSIKE